ncbi:MAG TPA: STAS domain-containing protein [Solirubrobacteraceae bacterium]|jgi:anti-sigma B factor antagonist
MSGSTNTTNQTDPNHPAFGIMQRDHDSRTSVVAVEGELDLDTAPRLKWMLMDAIETGRSRLVVDLSDATFIDSMTLSVLVTVKRSLDDPSRLAIVCTRENLLQIFEFAGLDGVFAIFPTLEEALAHVRGDTSGANRLE